MATLFLVPTPIGNLEDITLRALRVLRTSDLILAEDTRVSRKLLQHYQIDKPLTAYHQHNEHQRLEEFIALLSRYGQIALISDAGTPAISDPGFLLIRACLEHDISVECLPGATALIPALVNSGLPCDRFYFYGFLPHKKGRQSAIAYIAQVRETVVLYESPFRLVKTLQQLHAAMGKRRISVGRELTKMYEETVRGDFEEVTSYFSQKNIKGELVIVIEGKPDREAEDC
jgi:16S rRNA (cytidine1402-2'-O)-methyltransferase